MFTRVKKLFKRRHEMDFGDGGEDFNAGDRLISDIDPADLERLAELFASVKDRESAIAALRQVHGRELVVL